MLSQLTTDDTFVAKTRKRSSKSHTRTQSEYTLRGRTLRRNKASLLFSDEGKKGSAELIEKVEIPEEMVEDSLEIVQETSPDLPLAAQKSVAYSESLNEWMASNVFEFLSEVSLLYATVEPHHMKLSDEGKGFPLGVAYKFPGLSDKRASTYVDSVLAWMEDQVHNENIFPEDETQPFPDDFVEKYVTEIFKRMFRIYAIILTTCWDALIDVEADGRQFATSSFKHFYFFVLRHDLLQNQEEIEVLRSGFKAKSGWDIDTIEEEYKVCLEAYDRERK